MADPTTPKDRVVRHRRDRRDRRAVAAHGGDRVADDSADKHALARRLSVDDVVRAVQRPIINNEISRRGRVVVRSVVDLSADGCQRVGVPLGLRICSWRDIARGEQRRQDGRLVRLAEHDLTSDLVCDLPRKVFDSQLIHDDGLLAVCGVSVVTASVYRLCAPARTCVCSNI